MVPWQRTTALRSPAFQTRGKCCCRILSPGVRCRLPGRMDTNEEFAGIINDLLLLDNPPPAYSSPIKHASHTSHSPQPSQSETQSSHLVIDDASILLNDESIHALRDEEELNHSDAVPGIADNFVSLPNDFVPPSIKTSPKSRQADEPRIVLSEADIKALYMELEKIHAKLKSKYTELVAQERQLTDPYVQVLCTLLPVLTAEQWASISPEDIIPHLPAIASIHPSVICRIACYSSVFGSSVSASQMSFISMLVSKCAARALKANNRDVHAIHAALSVSSAVDLLQIALQSLENIIVSDSRSRNVWLHLPNAMTHVFRVATSFKTLAIVKPAVGCILSVLSVETGAYVGLMWNILCSRSCLRLLCNTLKQQMCMDECVVILQKICSHPMQKDERIKLKLVLEAEGVLAVLDHLLNVPEVGTFALTQIESIHKIMRIRR